MRESLFETDEQQSKGKSWGIILGVILMGFYYVYGMGHVANETQKVADLKEEMRKRL